MTKLTVLIGIVVHRKCQNSQPERKSLDHSLTVIRQTVAGKISANFWAAPLRTVTDTYTLPEPGVCGVSLGDRILGGKKTAINAYPWTALLLVQPIIGKAVSYGCGGSLISDQFVLTAAHCFEELPFEVRVTQVRLGEWDILADEDCVEGDCSDKPIDVRIGGHVVHADYDSANIHNDIALIKLAHPVNFTDFISPVCLPLADNLRSVNEDGKTFTVVGWGATENGTQAPGVFGNQYKLEVDVPGVSLEKCRVPYPDLLDSEMCAGGEEGKDSCQGDSGGCMAANDDGYWYQYGVVSWGKGCGRKGVPGVYARVTSYLDWIKEKMNGPFAKEPKWPIFP
ncbi:CLIP domain-containing serine protease B4-like [Uranotaenia lowii]|uniref:CLIP domain-containing serine protease B4-like n=1 Tax=Uranotaenia lowii TaxID=190385 RepID=UPI0024797F74|nr:CLIP domain-containing serine protease B4-like [Uranotaenia lowii]